MRLDTCRACHVSHVLHVLKRLKIFTVAAKFDKIETCTDTYLRREEATFERQDLYNLDVIKQQASRPKVTSKLQN